MDSILEEEAKGGEGEDHSSTLSTPAEGGWEQEPWSQGKEFFQNDAVPAAAGGGAWTFS